ncbi:MAG: hypothetical protein EOM03_14225 [Clostridia bacterium]|nr:hypothetical protein [Clostridia bacterium]
MNNYSISARTVNPHLNKIKIKPEYEASPPSPEKITDAYRAALNGDKTDRIVLGPDYTLLDGYATYLVAKMLGKERVKATRIDVEEIEPEKPTYYNGKVRCVSSIINQDFTVGKLYEFVDGIVRGDDGIEYNHSCPSLTESEALHRPFVTFEPYTGEWWDSCDEKRRLRLCVGRNCKKCAMPGFSNGRSGGLWCGTWARRNPDEARKIMSEMEAEAANGTT